MPTNQSTKILFLLENGISKKFTNLHNFIVQEGLLQE